MHQGQLRRESLVGEVGVKRLQLKRRHHPLVDEGARGQRREVCVQLVLGALAQTKGLAFKIHAADRPAIVCAR